MVSEKQLVRLLAEAFAKDAMQPDVTFVVAVMGRDGWWEARIGGSVDRALGLVCTLRRISDQALGREGETLH